MFARQKQEIIQIKEGFIVLTVLLLPCTLVRGGNLQPMVVVMDKEYIVCEQRTDEGLRLFNDDVVGTIRTINAGVINE